MTLPRKAIDRVLGTYAVGEMHLKVFMEGTQLKAQMAGQPAIDVFAESPYNFFLTVVDATLEFATGDTSSPAVSLRQGGQAIEFQRIP